METSRSATNPADPVVTLFHEWEAADAAYHAACAAEKAAWERVPDWARGHPVIDPDHPALAGFPAGPVTRDELERLGTVMDAPRKTLAKVMRARIGEERIAQWEAEAAQANAERLAWWDAEHAKITAACAEFDASEAERDRRFDRRHELFRTVASAKATTPAGLSAKLRLAALLTREDEATGTPEEDFVVRGHLMLSAQADAERLLA